VALRRRQLVCIIEARNIGRMRIAFIGADLEENLGLGILSAIAEEHGHRPRILPFNDLSQLDAVVEEAMRGEPDVVGLSIQFQHRAPEFLALSRKLRQAGYEGHVTAGGQFPTLAWEETLRVDNGVDSVALHDAEETIVELLQALEAGDGLAEVAGIALRDDEGRAFRTASRRLLEDLDSVPFAKRYRAHNEHMDVPFIPIIGGRGCWGKCNYCSIISFYDDAIKSGGGKAVRLRSAENIAAEMALLLDNAGGEAIFCFHDDNFIFPGEKFSLKRIRAIRAALDEYGVGRVAMVGKTRPDCVTPKLAEALAELGVIRLYVGVENGSEAGGEHLRRGTQQSHVREALASCRQAGIFVCYNLLVFEPKGSIDDVASNVRFIREHADHPVNFCRAEPYFGTALHNDLSAEQDLSGSYLGFNYRIDDDRTELLFRICSAAFRERNFSPKGVANRYMGLGYAANVLKRFYDVGGNTATLQRRASQLTRKISLDTAEYLDKAIALARDTKLDDPSDLERRVALLGLEIAAADRHWHEELDELYVDMRAFSASPPIAPSHARKPTPRFWDLKRSLAVGLSVATTFAACGDGTVVDPVPQDDDGVGGMVVDPPPPDGGGGVGGVGGSGGMGGNAGGEGGMVVDPPPPDGGGGVGGVGGMGALFDGANKRKLRLIDQWFDTSAKKAPRTTDLPLFAPPKPRLVAKRDGGHIEVRVEAMGVPMSTRWEADGSLDSDGTRACWTPAGDKDRVRVAIRSRGGIAVLSLGVSDVTA
jgi:radical SAM superfamily enzyme YgiQ (UPF0313 family)